MSLLVKKPLSVLDKTVTIQWRDALRALGKAIPHVASGNIDKTIDDLVDLATAIGVAPDAGDIAWLLIRRAITRALSDLIRDHRDLFRVDALDQHAIALAETNLDLDSEVLELDEQFFRNPGSLDLLDRLRSPIAAWFQAYGLPENRGQGRCGTNTTLFRLGSARRVGASSFRLRSTP